VRKIVVLAAAAALLALALAGTAQTKVRPQVGCQPKGCWPVYSHRDVDTDVYAI
jgi:hypothetical protein